MVSYRMVPNFLPISKSMVFSMLINPTLDVKKDDITDPSPNWDSYYSRLDLTITIYLTSFVLATVVLVISWDLVSRLNLHFFYRWQVENLKSDPRLTLVIDQPLSTLISELNQLHHQGQGEGEGG